MSVMPLSLEFRLDSPRKRPEQGSRPEQAQRSSGKYRQTRQFDAGTALRLFRPTSPLPAANRYSKFDRLAPITLIQQVHRMHDRQLLTLRAGFAGNL